MRDYNREMEKAVNDLQADFDERFADMILEVMNYYQDDRDDKNNKIWKRVAGLILKRLSERLG